eukprot:705324_1
MGNFGDLHVPGSLHRPGVQSGNLHVPESLHRHGVQSELFEPVEHKSPDTPTCEPEFDNLLNLDSTEQISLSLLTKSGGITAEPTRFSGDFEDLVIPENLGSGDELNDPSFIDMTSDTTVSQHAATPDLLTSPLSNAEPQKSYPTDVLENTAVNNHVSGNVSVNQLSVN